MLQSDASLQVGHWHPVSGPVRQPQKLLGPLKEAGFVELVLIVRVSRNWYRLCWKWNPLEKGTSGKLESSRRHRTVGAGCWTSKKSLGHFCGAAVGTPSERESGEDISMPEARAMVLSKRRLARTQHGGSIRQLFFCATIWALFLLLDAAVLATLRY